MTTLALKNLSRNPLRIGITALPTDGTPALVDTTDGDVQRDMRVHAGRFATVEAGTGLAGVTVGTPSTESGEAVTVSLQATTADGEDVAEVVAVRGFVSTDAAGTTPSDGSATITFSAGTDGALLKSDSPNFAAVTEADGDLDLVLTDAAGATQDLYLQILGADGSIIATSAAISFAA